MLISQMIFMLKTDDIAEFNEVFFILLTMILVAIKMMFLIMKRNKIINLDKLLMNPLMQRDSIKESNIQDAYDKNNRFDHFTLLFMLSKILIYLIIVINEYDL